LIPLFIISFLEFRKILFKYFLTYRILYKEFTNLVAQENYDLAQTKGHNLLKKLYRIKGNKHYGQIMGIVLDMGATYYLFKDKSCTKAKEGIKFFSEFMNKQAFPRSSENPSEKEWFFITYAGLYVRNNEPEIAKRLIIDNVEDDPQFYLDKINENKYDEIIKAK
jgi:hypothetical protein